jgi:CHAT domain-containing protein/Tfp pilus assembly protein PilF
MLKRKPIIIGFCKDIWFAGPKDFRCILKHFKWVLIITFLMNSLCIEAQSNNSKIKLDSLWITWNNTSIKDSIRLKAIGDYIWKGFIYDQPDSAIYLAKLQLDFASKVGLKNYQASALNTIGVAYKFKGDFSSSITYHLQNIQLFEEVGNKKGLSSSHTNIGNSYMEIGDYNNSLFHMEHSLKLKIELKDSIGIAASNLNIGIVQVLKGDFNKAQEFYSKSLLIYELKKDKKGIANCFHNIGRMYYEQGELTKSYEFNKKSLAIREDIKDKQGLAASHINIGLIYSKLGNKDDEIDSYQKALQVYQNIGDQRGVAKVYTNIANALDIKKDTSLILDYYKRSLKINESSGDIKGVADSFVNIGYVYSEFGDFENALFNYQESLKTYEKIQDKNRIAGTYYLISNVLKKQSLYKESIQFSKKSLDISLEINTDIRIRNSLKSLYENYVALDSIYLSEKYLSQLIERRNTNLNTNFFTLSESEKQSYFATMEKDYGLYHDFSLHYKNKIDILTATSYNIALQNKGLTLKSSTAMRTAVQNSGDTSLINQYEDWLSLKKKIAKLNEIDSIYKSLTDQVNQIERELVKKSTIFSDFDKVRNLKWQDVQTGLKPNEAAIEFIHFKSEIDTANPIIYAALIIKKDSKHPEMIRLCTEAELKEILGVFQGNNFSFVKGVYGTKSKAEKALYEKIWQPLEKHLQGVQNIYYSPSGLLHKVSFAAISKDNNVFLCDNYQLHQQSSTGKVALPSNVMYDSKDAYLLMGGVQYNTEETKKEIWNYLPGTLNETDNIQSFLEKKKHSVNLFAANDANETNFKTQAQKANVLHISTHGFFFPDPEQVREEAKKNEVKEENIIFRGTEVLDSTERSSSLYANWSFVINKNPLMRSGLVLAGANDVWQRNALEEGEDGILTAQEVSNLDLRNTKLVVLSACETGLGDIKGSEGVFGLQRAFKMAGAEFLIMSLWQVPDKETAEFMELFYKNLVKVKEIPKAFNLTQQVMRKKYDPYYWAAFVLIN